MKYIINFTCFPLLKIFSDVDHLFKSLLNFVPVLLLLYVFSFGCEACEISAPWPEIEPTPPAREGEVLTPGPPGKSLFFSTVTRTSARWRWGPQEAASQGEEEAEWVSRGWGRQSHTALDRKQLQKYVLLFEEQINWVIASPEQSLLLPITLPRRYRN